MKVSTTCAECGTLYESSEVNSETHRQNAVQKANGHAYTHTGSFPHLVAVDPGCPGCLDPTAPSHDGSRHCLSGSIASGGVLAHCTCGRCY